MEAVPSRDMRQEIRGRKRGFFCLSVVSVCVSVRLQLCSCSCSCSGGTTRIAASICSCFRAQQDDG